MSQLTCEAIESMKRAMERAITSEFITSRSRTFLLTDKGRQILRPFVSSLGWKFPEEGKPLIMPAHQTEAVWVLTAWGMGDSRWSQEEFLARIHTGLMSGEAYRDTDIDDLFMAASTIQLVVFTCRDFRISAEDFHLLLGVFVLECRIMLQSQLASSPRAVFRDENGPIDPDRAAAD